MVGLGWAQLACLSGSLVMVTVSVSVGGFPTGAVVSSPIWVLLIVAALVRVHGRVMVNYVPVVISFVYRRMLRQHQFRRPVWRVRPAGTLSLPGARARLRQYVDEATGSVMVHDPIARTLAATVAVVYGQFAVEEEAAQEDRVDGWAGLLNTVGQTEGVRRVQALVRNSADAGVGIREHWRLWPVKAPVGSAVRTSYEELVVNLGAATEAHRSTITIVLDLRRVEREIKRSGGGMVGAAAVMRRRMHTVETSLSNAGLHLMGWLGPDELALIVRSLYDPARSVIFERHPEVLGDLESAGPMAVDANWASVRTDSGWHKVVQIG